MRTNARYPLQATPGQWRSWGALGFIVEMKEHVGKVMMQAWHAKKEGETREAQNAVPALFKRMVAEQPKSAAPGIAAPHHAAGEPC